MLWCKHSALRTEGQPSSYQLFPRRQCPEGGATDWQYGALLAALMNMLQVKSTVNEKNEGEEESTDGPEGDPWRLNGACMASPGQKAGG